MKTAALLLSLLCFLVPLAGCGYSTGFESGGLYRADIRTIAVPVFGTESFSRGDEVALTQAIVNQIESRTPYKVVSRDRADTVLEGKITRVSASTVSSARTTSLPQEQLYTVQIDLVWKDLRSGRVIVERRGLDQSSTYFSTLGESRAYGRQQAIDDLAAAIVSELQTDF